MDKTLKGGLFDGRGYKPRPLEVRAKVKNKPTPEKKIQADFITWRNQNKREYPLLNAIFAVPNGIWAFKSVAKGMVAQGMTAGILDVICLAPSHDRKYFGLLIEFKNEVGELSDEQKFFIKFFSDLGYRTAIVRDADDAKILVKEYLGLTIPITRRG
jgi:hypothetical protein